MSPATVAPLGHSRAVVGTARRRGAVIDAAFLVILPWLPFLSAEEGFRVIGYIALALTAALLLLTLCARYRSDETRIPVIGFLLLLPIGAAYSSSLDFQAARQVLQLLLIALALRVSPAFRFGRLPRFIATGLCLILCAMELAFNLHGGIAVYSNPNGYGVASVCWAALLLRLNMTGGRWPVPRALLWLALPALLAVASESRSSLAAVGLMVLWIAVFAVVRTNWMRVTLTLFAFALSIIAVVMLAVASSVDTQDVIPTVGEKSGLSGRNIIWASILTAIEANGFGGFGLGSLPGGLLEDHYEGLSAHNGFLQIMYQFGWIGLLVLLGACVAFLVAMARRRDGGVSAGILLAVLVHELFEVVITQNHFGAGLLLWIMIASSAPGRISRTHSIDVPIPVSARVTGPRASFRLTRRFRARS